jgi:hypothetical protein
MSTIPVRSTSATWRGVTEQAAVAAIDSGTRVLRLRTIRDRFEQIAAAAQREQLSYLGFSPSWSWPCPTIGTSAAPPAASTTPACPAASASRSSTWPPLEFQCGDHVPAHNLHLGLSRASALPDR